MRADGTGARPRASVAAFRLLLLGLVALGLVQMHSFGHGAHDHHDGAGSVPAAAHPVGMAPPAPTDPDPGHGPTVDVLTMCLAILTSVALLGAVVVLRLTRVGGSNRRRGASPLRLRLGRDPPGVVALIGRQLASQSVLRI